METIFWIDMVGWAASAAVLATFCVNTMMPLRVLAIISNVLFCAYGAVAHIFPVLILHAILLPVNVVRLVQIRRLVHGMQAAEHSELSVQSLLPPIAWAEWWRRNPVIYPGPGTGLGRIARTKEAVHIADLTKEQAYLERDPLFVGQVELAGGRTLPCDPQLIQGNRGVPPPGG